MKKGLLLNTSASILIIFLFGCKKDGQIATNSIGNGQSIFIEKIVKMAEHSDGSVFIYGVSDGNKSNKLHDGYATASFYVDKGKTQTHFPYNISLENIPLLKNGNALAFQFGDLTQSKSLRESFLKLFGKKISISFSPNSNQISLNNVLDSEMELPEPIFLESDFCETGVIDNDLPFSVNWNPGIANEAGNVYIGVMYEGDYANTYDGVQVAPGTYLIEVFEVEDNGGYAIPSEIFNFLPVGSRCSLFIARANAVEVIDEGQGLVTALQAVVIDQKDVMKVVE
jgi:hypothetical protein